MYKRPARVLFWSWRDPCAGLLARAVAMQEGASWLTARAGVWGEAPGCHALARFLRGRGLTPDGELEPLDGQLLAWADLLVTLDAQARSRCPPLASTTRPVHWPVPEAPGAYGQLYPRLRRRIGETIGGLRLLSRLDEGESGG
ncbi:MAG TPA: hypothetical protein VKA14_09920 [Gammaproteobacteria bacterium]|nr:hypothetical protein [Gammaproteobacteria bacterium]